MGERTRPRARTRPCSNTATTATPLGGLPSVLLSSSLSGPPAAAALTYTSACRKRPEAPACHGSFGPARSRAGSPQTTGRPNLQGGVDLLADRPGTAGKERKEEMPTALAHQVATCCRLPGLVCVSCSLRGVLFFGTRVTRELTLAFSLNRVSLRVHNEALAPVVKNSSLQQRSTSSWPPIPLG